MGDNNLSGREELWKKINEPIKHFFDSLRNISIAVSIILAGKFISSHNTYGHGPLHGRVVEYCGYAALILAVFHFSFGVWAILPNGRNLWKLSHKNPYGIQIYLAIIYFLILWAALMYATNK